MRTERLTTAAAAAYRSTFAPDAAAPEPGASLAPGWEGLTFAFDTAFADLRPDGSPARDGVLPEFDLPRRMYAGEDTEYLEPLRFGDVLEQETRAGTITEKTGRAGRLVFADILREYRVDGRVAISSVWHDVFLDAATPSAGNGPLAPAQVPPDSPPDWSEELTLDARQLFRFSALTFNTHRVHYDRDWARKAEGLPGLLVHGPLTRILLLDAARRRRPDAVARYGFRAIGPAFADERLRLEGRDTGDTAEVVAIHPDRGVTARGIVTWR